MIKTSNFRAVTLAGVFRAAIALSGLCVAGVSANAQMTIPGKFDVTPVGAASYAIPIQVPPGIAGVEPKLTLAYNSRGGNGLLGVGWTLGGLPTITRCPLTTPQDGVKGSVAYNADDRFCLDGKRLMVVSGTYGAAGSSYRTEIESFANVTAFGSAGSGPQYFVVKTKEGLTMEFGNSADSRVAVAGLSTIRVWALNKVADSVGNTQSISYALPQPIETSTSEHNTYPQRIDYTSNGVTGLSAANSVEFSYESRSDVISGYRGSYPFKTSVRLAGITTRTNGSVVSTYTPTYAAGAGGRSTITSLSLCAASGLCAPVMRFGIGSVTGSLFPIPGASIMSVTATESSVSGGKWFAMDVNGDGMTDLLHLTTLSGVYRVWQSRGDGTFTIRESTTTADTDLSSGSWHVLDVDGDSRPDLVHLTTGPGDMRVWKSNGDGTFAITPFTNSTDTDLSNGNWQVLDVDGDGLADLFHLVQINSGQARGRAWKSNGDGTFTIAEPIIYGLYAYPSLVLDLNGDGLADMLSLTREPLSPYTAGEVDPWFSNGDGSFRRSFYSVRDDLGDLAEGTWKQLDLNGDGFVDLVHIRTDGGMRVWLVKGHGELGLFDISTFTQTVDTNLADGAWEVLDANGDGLQDLVHTPSNLSSGRYWVWHSNGDGTFSVTATTDQWVDTCSSNCTMMKAGDFMGIGAPGFVRLDGNTVKSAWFLSRQPRNIMTSVSNGIGGSTSWSLSPLPGMLVRGTYAKDVPSDNATWTLTSALPVVETVRTNTGWIHEASDTSYDRTTYFSYGSARVERNGRGFLGFNWLQSKDSATGLTTRTYFRQDFPFTGSVATRGTGSGGAWNNLSLTTMSWAFKLWFSVGSKTYGCTQLDGGSTCSAGAGSRYFIFPSQVDTQSWDLDGTALPRTRVVNADPDNYGNLGTATTSILNPDGSATDYSKVVTNTYYNDPQNWYIGRLLKSVVTTSGPPVAPPVTPGSGGLPPAPPPQLPAQTTAALMAILELLLSDD